MTTFDPLDDERASAYLDGELAPDERDAAANDPALLARAGTFTGLATALRAVAPRPALDTERAIAAALDAPIALAPVVHLSRTRARWRPTWAVAGLAAAAAVVVMAWAATRSPDATQTASRATTTSTIASPATAAGAEVKDGSASATALPSNLGAADDIATLIGRLRSMRSTTPAVAGSPLPPQPGFGATVEALKPCSLALTPGTLSTVVWKGSPAIVAVRPGAGGSVLITVYDPLSCLVLAEAPLP